MKDLSIGIKVGLVVALLGLIGAVYWVGTNQTDDLVEEVIEEVEEIIEEVDEEAIDEKFEEEVSTESSIENEEEILESMEEPVDFVIGFSRASTVATSSYTLEDDSGYGFAYDASNVLDLDYSTAWCRGDYDTDVDGPWAGGLELFFEEPPSGQTVGIVPGFARDEDIFYQNNRVKKLVVAYGGALAYSETFEFKDSFEMQFFEWPDMGDHTQAVLYVTDVYSGSKYDDTCIAEIDFWSEWVVNQDAQAAYNYYESYKKDAAFRPVGMENVGMSMGDVVSECGEIDTTRLYDEEIESIGNSVYTYKGSGDYVYSFSDEGDGQLSSWNAEASNPIVVAAQMNEWAELGDQIIIKWVNTMLDRDDPTSRNFIKDVFWVAELEVSECSEGSKYVYDYLDFEEIPNVGPVCVFGSCQAMFYYEDRLIGTSPIYQHIQ
jgi:hypothetical protein